MSKIYTSRFRSARNLLVGVLLLTANLPLLLEFHVLAGAPGAHHGTFTGTAIAETFAPCSHGRSLHLEVGQPLKPCPICFMGTTHRLATASCSFCPALPTTSVLTVPTEQIGPAYAVILRAPRGPPAIS